MTNFWDLLRDSVIIQGVIVIAIFGMIAYLLASKQEVPSELWQAMMLVLGFFFGSKVQKAIGG